MQTNLLNISYKVCEDTWMGNNPWEEVACVLRMEESVYFKVGGASNGGGGGVQPVGG